MRKSRNSSSGLYRCRRRSAHDRRRTNAMRFLMNTLLAHPIPRSIMRSSKTLFGYARLSPLSRVPCEASLSPSELLACHNYSSQSFGASSILLSKLLARDGPIQISPAPVCVPQRTYFPRRRTTSGVGSSNHRVGPAVATTRGGCLPFLLCS